jgi:hypothetical protein
VCVCGRLSTLGVMMHVNIEADIVGLLISSSSSCACSAAASAGACSSLGELVWSACEGALKPYLTDEGETLFPTSRRGCVSLWL